MEIRLFFLLFFYEVKGTKSKDKKTDNSILDVNKWL